MQNPSLLIATNRGNRAKPRWILKKQQNFHIWKQPHTNQNQNWQKTKSSIRKAMEPSVRTWSQGNAPRGLRQWQKLFTFFHTLPKAGRVLWLHQINQSLEMVRLEEIMALIKRFLLRKTQLFLSDQIPHNSEVNSIKTAVIISSGQLCFNQVQ